MHNRHGNCVLYLNYVLGLIYSLAYADIYELFMSSFTVFTSIYVN